MQSIKNFYNLYGYYYLRIWLIHVLALSGLFIFSFTELFYVFVATFLFFHLYAIIYHDWISHSYINPRNFFIKWMLLLLFYSQDNTIKKKKSYHVFHHKNWLDEKTDPTQQKISGKGLIRYIFSLHKPVQQNIPDLEITLLEKEPLIKFLDKNARIFYSVLIALVLFFLPLIYFFTLAIYFPCITALVTNCHDYYFHGPLKGKDKNYLTLVFSAGAWHVSHHTCWKEEYYGPKYWNLLNPAWYYRKLLFVKA